jgi:surface-anchored protein/MYXO-CTERM domain-containing protein
MPRMSAALRRTAALLAAAAACGGTTGAALASAPEPAVREAPAGERVVLDAGHLDVGPRFDGGRWSIAVRDDTVQPARWRDPDDVVIHVPDAARSTVPPSGGFGFLGRPGAIVWLLPQVQREDVAWPGWSTQDPAVVRAVPREVAWRLRDVAGPGAFALFVNGEFGAPRVLFDPRRPLPQETGIDVDTHGHGNWTFTAAGAYLLDVEMTARTRDGARLAARAPLRFLVGDGDPRSAFATVAPSAGDVAGADSATTILTVALAAAAVLALAALATLRRRRRAGR